MPILYIAAWAWLGLGWPRSRRQPRRDTIRELFDIVEW